MERALNTAVPKYLYGIIDSNNIVGGYFLDKQFARLFNKEPTSSMFIDFSSSEEENVMQALYKMGQFHPDFILFTYGFRTGEYGPKKIEKEIEEWAKKVYRERGDVVDLVKKKISEVSVKSKRKEEINSIRRKGELEGKIDSQDN